MPYGTVNADTLVTSTSGGILGAGNASIMKNRIINGAMVINQRALGTVTVGAATQTYTIDRMRAYSSVASKYSVSQATNTGLAKADGFNYSYNVTSLSAYTSGASDIIGIAQSIEGYNIADLQWGTASAKTVTLSFWVQSSLTGSFGGTLYTASGDYSYPFSYTISAANTWQKIAITVAGPTSGTWESTTSTGINVWFDMGSGTSFKGTANTWSSSLYFAPTGSTNITATNGATWNITALQLEVGSSATGFEYRQYTTELQLCQRYYEQLGYGSLAIAEAGSTYVMCLTYRTQKRAAASIGLTVTSNIRLRQFGTADRDASSASAGNVAGSTTGASFKVAGFNSIGATSSSACVCYTTSSEDGNLFYASAEL